MVRNAKRWTDGHASVTGTATHMTIEREARGEDGTWTVRLDWDSDATFAEVLEDLGKTPLPRTCAGRPSKATRKITKPCSPWPLEAWLPHGGPSF